MRRVSSITVLVGLVTLLGLFFVGRGTDSPSPEPALRRELNQVICVIESPMHPPSRAETERTQALVDAWVNRGSPWLLDDQTATTKPFTPGDWRFHIATIKGSRRPAGHRFVISTKDAESGELTPLLHGRTGADGQARLVITPGAAREWEDVRGRLVCAIDEPGFAGRTIGMHCYESDPGPLARTRLRPRSGFARRIQLVNSSGATVDSDFVLEHAPNHDRWTQGKLTVAARNRITTLHLEAETNAVLHGFARGVGSTSMRVQDIFALGPSDTPLSLTVEAFGSVSGALVNEGGHPLAGVRLQLALKDSSKRVSTDGRHMASYDDSSPEEAHEVAPGGNIAANTQTDANGLFEVGGLSEGEFEVRAASDGSRLGSVQAAGAPARFSWNRTWVNIEPTVWVPGSTSDIVVALSSAPDPEADTTEEDSIGSWATKSRASIHEVMHFEDSGARFLLRSGATYELKLTRVGKRDKDATRFISIEIPAQAAEFTVQVDCP